MGGDRGCDRAGTGQSSAVDAPLSSSPAWLRRSLSFLPALLLLALIYLLVFPPVAIWMYENGIYDRLPAAMQKAAVNACAPLYFLTQRVPAFDVYVGAWAEVIIQSPPILDGP